MTRQVEHDDKEEKEENDKDDDVDEGAKKDDGEGEDEEVSCLLWSIGLLTLRSLCPSPPYEAMNLVEFEDVLNGELGRYVKIVGCVVGFDDHQFMAIVEDSRRNKLPVRLPPTEACVNIHRFQKVMFNGIISQRFENEEERCLQVLSFMHVDYGLDMKVFDEVQSLRREVFAECIAVNSKTANEVLLDLSDKVEFMVEDWDECLDVVVNHIDRDKQPPMNEDRVSLEEFVYENCDDARQKCLRPLPFIYEDLVKQVFQAVGEVRYTSLAVKRILDRLVFGR
ncbi:hypothetical protein HPB50_003255 [Hyalomma asiaticum]|uniref:Uncharacterized protein n=1 Tax=Hyalomma asiaticum TaxID=266040 RepID=A0ACB7RQA7_HYAAI|nr:hypothetical protein HPB50_003255 [Hyalomma asiaticum]